MLYLLVSLFACVGAGLLIWNISRNYQQTLELHGRQLDVGAMVAEDYLSQTLEQTRLLLLDRSSQWLQLPPERHGDLSALLQLPVRTADGRTVAIGELVTVTNTLREQPIYHKDLLPMNLVVADMAGKVDSPLYGMFAARSAIATIVAPDGAGLEEYFIRQPSDPYRGYAIKWDGEWKITYETFRDMGLAYSVGLLLIYFLVVAQFRSYVVPLIIMVPIPLTIIGVMPGHALLGVALPAKPGEATLNREGETYLLMEPTGPTQLAMGQLAPTSKTLIDSKQLSVQPVRADK